MYIAIITGIPHRNLLATAVVISGRPLDCIMFLLCVYVCVCVCVCVWYQCLKKVHENEYLKGEWIQN